MARVQTETGPRFVQEDVYRGWKIEVVTGYDINSDRWPFHVYITPPGEPRREVDGKWKEASESDAFDHGFIIAQAEIDQTTQP